MAYKTKYKVGFYDFYKDYYELWIKKRDFEDLPTFILAGPNPCTISMLGAGDDIFETIKGQELVLEIISEIDYEFEEFFTASDREYIVELHPGKDTAVGAMSLVSVDTGATADPTFEFEFTEYGAATGLKPKAVFSITDLLSTTNTQTIRLYQGRIDNNNNLIKTLISETLNIVLANYTKTELAQLIIDNISNPDFEEAPFGGGSARTIVATNEYDSNGFPIAYTKFIFETSDKIQHWESDFTLGLESPRFSILIGEQQFKKINGWNVSWFDFRSDEFISTEGETIPQLCDRIVAAIDGKPAGIYGDITPWDIEQILLDIEPPPWTIRALHDGAGKLTFTLQGGGSDYNDTFFSIWSENNPQFNTTGGFYTNPYIGYLGQTFAGGTSDAVTYKIQIDTGTGWVDLVTYTKVNGDDIFDIIAGLVNLINATTYSAIVDTTEPRRIIITPPPPETGIGWKLQWVFSGTATGISEDFSPVNPDIILWKGFIIPGLYNEPHKQPPYMVGLRATDGLGDLKDVDFVDSVGDEITGNISLLDVITVCLSKTNLNFEIAERMNLYEDEFLQQNSDSSLAQTYIDGVLLKNQSCEFVLKKILEEFTSRVFQYNGLWLIERLPELDAAQNERLFDRNGVYKSVSSKYNEIIIAGSSGPNHIIDGTGNLEVDSAYREVRTKHDYGLKIQLLKNASFDNGLDGQWQKTSIARYLFPGEHYGYASVLQDLGDAYNESSNPNHDLQWFQQQFELEKTEDHKYRITGKYIFQDPDSRVSPNPKVKILIGLNIEDIPFQPYYADKNGQWNMGQEVITLDVEEGRWLTFDIILDSLPVSGLITFRIYMMHLAVAVENVWTGWDYATFEIVADLPFGEYVALRYRDSYQDYNGIKEIDMIASDVPSVPSRDTVYSAVLKNSDNNALRFWDNGRTLTSIARNVMFKQLGTYGQRLTADILSQNYDFSTIVKDSLNDDKVFVLNGCSWSLKKGVFSGEWIQISKPLLNEPTEELFLPFEERKEGSQTYNPNPGGGGSTFVTLPADLLRETDVIDNLLSNSYLKPLSANMGRYIKEILDGFYDINLGLITVNQLLFNQGQTPVDENVEGLTWWNDLESTLNISTGLGAILQAGQEIQIKVYNNTGVLIPNGTAVYPNGAFNDFPTIGLAKTDTHENVAIDYGLTTTNIPIDGYGFVVWFGKARSLNTSAFNIGDRLYISATNAGEITNIRPAFPNYTIQIGVVFKIHATDGIVFVTSRSTIDDTLINIQNGNFREKFDFRVESVGGVVTGSLEPSNGHDDMTMMFSSGFELLTTTPPATIQLTPGTADNLQKQFVYIPIATKVLTLSLTDWPTTEHIKVATIVLDTAATTETDGGAFVNRNHNNFIQDTNSNMGQQSRMLERMRQEPARHKSGTQGSLVINTTPIPDDVFLKVTAGKVFQIGLQDFPAFDMETGDFTKIMNDISGNIIKTANLNTISLDSTGTALSNKSFSLVHWGQQNKNGETSFVNTNLPSGSYAKNSPDLAVSDAFNYSDYSIPDDFNGTGFLIGRSTWVLDAAGTSWTLYDYEDLTKKTPNTTAGGGGGGAGFSTNLSLIDTPATYAGFAYGLFQVNAAETAMEYSNDVRINSIISTDGLGIDIGGGALFVDEINLQVGVNVTNPSAALEVVSDTWPIIITRSTNSISYIHFYNSFTGNNITDGAFVGNNSGHFYFGNRESTGIIGIGTVGRVTDLQIDSNGNVKIDKILYSDVINELNVGFGITAESVLLKDGRAFNFDSTAPTTDSELANKLYVDTIASGTSKWDSVTGGINYAGGNVGINDITPTYKLDVNGDGHFVNDLTLDSDLLQPDNATHFFGTGNDAGILHNSTDLLIQGYLNSTKVIFQSNDSGSVNRSLITLNPDGAIDLYHKGVLKLSTSLTGISIDGAGVFTSNVTTIAPSADLHAATKKYVDDSIVSGGSKWDTATGGINYVGGNVGINDITPTYKLDVNGDGHFVNDLIIDSKIGIGTTIPGYSLDVVSTTIYATRIYNTDDTKNGLYVRSGANNRTTFSLVVQPTDASVNNFLVYGNGDAYFHGDVGIGIEAKASIQLTVSGDASISGPTLGSAIGHFYLAHASGAFGMIAGISGSGDTWLQSQRIDTNPTAYNLIFQPSGGKVGIGTLIPARRLDITDTTTQLRLTRSANSEYSEFYSDSAGGLIINTQSSVGTNYMIFSLNGSEKMRILPNGDVGINDTSPTYKLDVNGDGRFTSDLTAASFNFGSAKTYYYAINPSAYDALNPSTANINKNSLVFTIINGTTTISAPINLPHGATITSIIMRGNSAASSRTWTLTRKNNSASNGNTMATANINTTDSSIAYATIDNQNYSYSIATSLLVSLDAVYETTITYTLSSL